MATDDTLLLISKLKVITDQYIIKKLQKYKIDGIVPSHGAILYTLITNGPLKMCELSERIQKDPSTITTLVKKLEGLNYVELCKDEKDKRITLVRLTEKGYKFIEIFAEISNSIYEIQYKDMSNEEILILRKLLNKMLINFNKC